jgi:hypothetical protein
MTTSIFQGTFRKAPTALGGGDEATSWGKPDGASTR